MWRDPDPASGGGPGMILGIETSCDETAAALVGDDGTVHASVISSQAALHAPYGGVVPGGRVASASRADRPRRPRGSHDGWRRSRATSTASPSRAGPGLVGALLVGLSAAKAIAWSRRLPLVPVDHLHGHVASLYLGDAPVEPPFVCLLASGGHTQLLAVRDRTPDRADRHHARRRRRARRSTRARGCSGSDIRVEPRSTGSRADGDPAAYRVPGRARPGARLLVQRSQDGAALHGARPRRGRAGAIAAPISPRRTSTPSSARSSSVWPRR